MWLSAHAVMLFGLPLSQFCSQNSQFPIGPPISQIEPPRPQIIRLTKLLSSNAQSSAIAVSILRCLSISAAGAMGHCANQFRCTSFESCCSSLTVINTAGIRKTSEPTTHMITAPVTWSAMGCDVKRIRLRADSSCRRGGCRTRGRRRARCSRCPPRPGRGASSIRGSARWSARGE